MLLVTQPEEGISSSDKAQDHFGSKLKQFYKELFNPEYIFRVLKREKFQYREFGFDILGSHFVRNRSFAEPSHLKEYLYTFPVGGVYVGAEYARPVHGSAGGQKPVSIHEVEWKGRELVFDLDANEYDPVRTCGCQGKKVCENCWVLLQDAAEIINETLKEDFGFKKIQWVFTGGRGYHCWVLDDIAFSLDQDQRSGILGYMQLIHDPLGEQRVEDISTSADRLRERIYRLLGVKFVMEASDEVFSEIGIKKAALKTMRSKIETKNFQRFVDVIPKNHEEFLRQLIKHRYPRIDHKVSIDTKRLIRLPGTIHSRTGFVVQYVDHPETFTLQEAVHFETLL